jgi:hydrogenase expression/formation protein HypD
MKYVSEYRAPEIVEALLREIKETVKGNWHIMEVCGGQTHSLVKNGILNMLPANIQMIHAPGPGAWRNNVLVWRYDTCARQRHEPAGGQIKRR